MEPGRWLNCYNNTEKVLVEDNSETYYALKNVCPWYIGKQPNSTYTCCDFNQIYTLQSSTSKLAQKELSQCPACFQNFMNIFCAITCDPSNSLFMDAQRLYNDNTSIDIVGVYFTNYYTNKFFNSCKNVKDDTYGCSDGDVIDLMCGSNDPCTGQKLLKFLGTSQPSSPAAFELNFTFTSDPSGHDLPTNISARNATLLNCNDSVNGVTCSCRDCPAACPSMPTIPPDNSSSKTSYISIGIFAGVVSILICAIVFGMASISLTTVEKYAKIYSTDISHGSLFLTRINQKFENLISQLFSWWGHIVIDYWYFVTPTAMIVVFACCTGLAFVEVTTDPVELWATPNSRGQKEKEYFDQHFSYSYRPSQIIITAPNSPGFSFNDTEQYFIQYHASGMFQQDILNEVSLLINLDNIHTRSLNYRFGICRMTL